MEYCLTDRLSVLLSKPLLFCNQIPEVIFRVVEAKTHNVDFLLQEQVNPSFYISSHQRSFFGEF